MKTFSVFGRVSGSKFLGTVKAETAEEAIKKAPAECDWFCVDLCHHCASECEDPEIDGFSVESDDGDESAREDGFWEGQYYKAQAEVHELERRLDALERSDDVTKQSDS